MHISFATFTCHAHHSNVHLHTGCFLPTKIKEKRVCVIPLTFLISSGKTNNRQKRNFKIMKCKYFYLPSADVKMQDNPSWYFHVCRTRPRISDLIFLVSPCTTSICLDERPNNVRTYNLELASNYVINLWPDESLTSLQHNAVLTWEKWRLVLAVIVEKRAPAPQLLFSVLREQYREENRLFM